MNFLFNVFILFLSILILDNKSHALSDNQIKEICQKNRKRLTCIKSLKFKRSELKNGNRIEIPVIPFRK